MKHRTRPAKQTRFVVVSREGVEVIRDTESRDYEARVYGQYIGSYPTQIAAENAADAAMFALLNERKAAA